MAKTAAEQTPAQKDTLDKRQKLESAKKANTDKPSEKTAASVAVAEQELKKAVATENRERFVRVGGGRVKKARSAIRNLSNVAAPRSYTYDESDVAKVESVLGDEVKKTVSALRAALANPGKAAKAQDDFTF